LNPHRTRNHGSREHRESIKRMLDKTKRDNRAKVLRGKLQKMANIGINWEGMARKHATPLTHKEHQTHSWLSPSGEFYDLDEFGNSEHQQWIKTLLDKHGDKNLTKQYSRNEEESLGEGFEDDMDDIRFMEDSNFIRLNSDGYKELDIGTANEPTNAQNKAIQDLAISRGFKSDNIIVDGYYPGTEENYGGEKQLRRRMGLNKLGKLKVRAQKMAVRFTSSFGPDWDAIDAFKSKEKYLSKKFESTGNELKLNGHVVARHHKDGIEVSNAGHDTNKTYSTIKGLGIHARNQKGITKLNNKVIDVNSGEFVLVPHKDISDKPITYTKTKPQKRYRSVGEQSKFRDLVEKNEASVQGRKGKLPLSQINIQPKDQKQINKITGVKSPIGKEILGVEAHHILSHKKNKGLATNPNNGIMIPKQDHKMLTSFAKLKGRLNKLG